MRDDSTVFPELLKLEVTQADIDAGIAGDPSWCPIARAVRRQYPAAVNIEVLSSELSLELPGGDPLFGDGAPAASYEGPASMEEFIERFDYVAGEPGDRAAYDRKRAKFRALPKPTTFRLHRVLD